MRRGFGAFLFRSQFLARASLFELAAGLMIVISLQRVFDRLIADIVLPVVGSLTGGLDFSESFFGLSHAVTATNLVDAKKQGAVLAYGDFLTSLFYFLIVFVILGIVLRVKSTAISSAASAIDQPSGQEV
jgi:large conductance mechanosensitive channel